MILYYSNDKEMSCLLPVAQVDSIVNSRIPVHRYFFTGPPLKFTGGPLNITGAPLYFTGAPLYLPVDC